MKKIMLTIFAILVVGFLFLMTRINKENRGHVTNYQMLDGSEVKGLLNDKKAFYVIIISSMCSGSPDYMPKLLRNLEKLKAQKIPFLVIADELYKDNLDNDLNDFKKLYNFKEDLYIFNKDVYEENGGLFNNKKRYNDFLIDFLGKNHNIPLGYGIYLYFENSKLINYDITVQ